MPKSAIRVDTLFEEAAKFRAAFGLRKTLSVDLGTVLHLG
jgi:hypothetical protein